MDYPSDKNFAIAQKYNFYYGQEEILRRFQYVLFKTL